MFVFCRSQMHLVPFIVHYSGKYCAAAIGFEMAAMYYTNGKNYDRGDKEGEGLPY